MAGGEFDCRARKMNVLAKSSESGRWDSHGIAIVRRHFIGVGDHISQKLLLIILAIPGFMIAVSLFLAAAERAFPKIGRHEGVRWAEFQSNTTSLFNILKFGGNDSWGPMLDARRWLALHPGGDVYQGLFFAGRIKFQYPLSSLLFIDWIPAGSAHAITICNIANLMLFFLLAFGTALVLAAMADKTFGPTTAKAYRAQLACIAVLASLCFYPILRALDLGQVQILVDVLFTWACYHYLKDKSFAAGTLIGLCVLLKPQMGLFCIWALVRRDWKFLQGWLLTAGGGFAVSLIKYGVEWPFQYLKVLSYIQDHGESSFANQSVNGLAHRALGLGPNLHWDANAFAPSDPLITILTSVTSAAFILIGLFGIPRKVSIEMKALPLIFAAICFTMASPVAWNHHYGILLPAFGLCAILFLSGNYSSRYWLALGTLFFLCENSLAMTNWLAETRYNFIQSYLFIGALGLLAPLLCLARRNNISAHPFS